jgi:hypothetical protein
VLRQPVELAVVSGHEDKLTQCPLYPITDIRRGIHDGIWLPVYGSTPQYQCYRRRGDIQKSVVSKSFVGSTGVARWQ